jgi:ribonuclease D
LKKYLNKENAKKAEISGEMTNNLEFWDQRPLSLAMVEYASQDVIYLPNVYHIFKSKMRRSLISEIFEKSSNCHFYSLINKDHPGIKF